MSARTPAPGLPDQLTWVNARDVPRLWALRGRVVLLHFFAYGNINCQHVLPDLRYLENKYHDGITILGIHTPKFSQERQPAALLKASSKSRLRRRPRPAGRLSARPPCRPAGARASCNRQP